MKIGTIREYFKETTEFRFLQDCDVFEVFLRNEMITGMKLPLEEITNYWVNYVNIETGELNYIFPDEEVSKLSAFLFKV